MKEQEIVKLTEREHILKRPGMYLGSSVLTKIPQYILENDAFVYKEIEYVPGLLKIFNEIIDNSIDEYVRTKGEFANKIQVHIDKEQFTVQDNGRGIPVKKVKIPNNEEIYQPVLAWTHARAGSNFKDDTSTTIGTNGVGSMIASVFSTKFIGISDDGENKCKVLCKDNNLSIDVKILKSTTRGTKVTLYPDLKRFGLNEITDIHINLIKQRLLNLSISYPDIIFSFNSKRIRLNPKDFIKMFAKTSDSYKSFEIQQSDDYVVAIMHSDADEFRQFSLMNGLTLTSGGTHVDLIMNNIVQRVRSKLIKKYKSIKPADIKNKLFLITIMRNFKGPVYESQTKEKLTNTNKEVQEYFKDLNFDTLSNRILKNKEIISHIVDYFKIKEEFQKQQELKKLDKKKKKPKSEKFMPPIGSWTNCFLAEGDSAQQSISKILGREGNGFFAMFGVPPNAYDSSIQTIIKSKKMIEIKDILGLQFSASEQNDINFQNIIIATDYDLPGHFIAGQLLGLFYKFAKNLFKEKRIKRFVTPLIVAKKGDKIIDWFYTFDDYNKFDRENPKKYTYEYKKGLGSWDQEELNIVINKDTLEGMLITYTIDDAAPENIDAWLNSKRAQTRKDMLDGYEFNIMSV